MTRPRAPIETLSDQELERLAAAWRAQALRGDRTAFGKAHVLEVEQRRRLRDSQLAQLEQEPHPTATPRPWWKFWAADPDAADGQTSPP
jgi:hypothetical protein